MEIEWVTHASISVRAAEYTLLTDPFFFFDEQLKEVMCHFPPRHFDERSFGRLDYVYSSHVHPDHSHPETLSRLRGQIGTVLLPGERPDLEQRYRDLGFRDIVILANGETLKLRPDLEVTSFWDGPVDSVLVARCEDRAILHQNDCALKMRTLAAIARRFEIDYAFLSYTWLQDLTLLLPRSEDELTRLIEEKDKDGVAYQLGCIDVLRPGMVIPYSMTMTFFQKDQLHLNGYGRTTPPVFVRRVRERRPEQRCEVLQPGDVIEADTGEVRRLRAQSLWGEDLAEFLANVAAYARENPDGLPRFSHGDAGACEEPLKAHFARRLEQPVTPILAGRQVWLHVVGERERRSYVVDLEERTFRATVDADCDGAAPLLEITLPASLLAALLAETYDPFAALFSHRIRFQPHGELARAPKEEIWAYIVCLVSLFRPDLQDELMARGAV